MELTASMTNHQSNKLVEFEYTDANKLTFYKLFALLYVKRYYEKISFIHHFGSDNC